MRMAWANRSRFAPWIRIEHEVLEEVRDVDQQLRLVLGLARPFEDRLRVTRYATLSVVARKAAAPPVSGYRLGEPCVAIWSK